MRRFVRICGYRTPILGKWLRRRAFTRVIRISEELGLYDDLTPST
jgi:hypothetical protein